MSEKNAANPTQWIRLHRITRDDPPMACEIPGDKLRQFAREQRMTPDEMRRLIDDLLAHLPEPERMAFYAEIRTSDMI